MRFPTLALASALVPALCLAAAPWPRFTLSPPITLAADPTAGDSILSLPGLATADECSRLTRHGSGEVEWHGRLRGDPRSSVLLVTHQGATVGRIETQGRQYVIRRSSGGAYMLDQTDLAGFRAARSRIGLDQLGIAASLPLLAKRTAEAVAAPTGGHPGHLWLSRHEKAARYRGLRPLTGGPGQRGFCWQPD